MSPDESIIFCRLLVGHRAPRVCGTEPRSNECVVAVLVHVYAGQADLAWCVCVLSQVDKLDDPEEAEDVKNFVTESAR